MNFNQMLEVAEKKGMESIAKQNACFADGGHIRTRVIRVGKKEFYKCWCGFSAPIDSRIWKKTYQCCYCLNDIIEFPDLVVSADELVCKNCGE